jgi:hypothetical protein
VGVRVKILIRLAGREVETPALVNSGFETDTPQLLVPVRLLSANLIDPSELGEASIEEYDTAGGPVAMHIYPNSCRVRVVEPDKSSREVTADLVVSYVEREVLIGDALTEELGIIILSPRRGLWRFIDDPYDKTRYSQRPRYW